MRIFVFFLTGVLLVSCQKDPLEGQYAVLIGTWQWAESTYFGKNLEVYNPSTEGFTYSLEFKKEGKYIIYKNGDVVESGRLLLGDPQSTGNQALLFPITFARKLKKVEDVAILNMSSDTLNLSYIPKELENITTNNFFVR